MSTTNFAKRVSIYERGHCAHKFVVVVSLVVVIVTSAVGLGVLIYTDDTRHSKYEEVGTTLTVDMFERAYRLVFKTKLEGIANFNEIKNGVDTLEEESVKPFVENNGVDIEAGYRTMSYEVLDELFRAQNKNPYMTLEETKKIAGEPMELGFRHVRDEEGHETDELLDGYAWSDEKHNWQLQIWYTDAGKMATTEIVGDFDISKSRELQDVVDTSEPEGE